MPTSLPLSLAQAIHCRPYHSNTHPHSAARLDRLREPIALSLLSFPPSSHTILHVDKYCFRGVRRLCDALGRYGFPHAETLQVFFCDFEVLSRLIYDEDTRRLSVEVMAYDPGEALRAPAHWLWRFSVAKES